MLEDICAALCNYSPEWQMVVSTYFEPKCKVLGYCPEKHGCGRYPQKEGKE